MAKRKPHIHVMAICHKHGPMLVALAEDLDGFEKYLDDLVDQLMAIDEPEENVKIHSRALYSLEFHRVTPGTSEKHEFMVTYSWCPRILQNCRLRMALDDMDRMDIDATEADADGMIVSMGDDGVANVRMVGGDLNKVPEEIRAVIEKIIDLVKDSGLGMKSAPDMESIMGSEQDAINKRFNDLMGLGGSS